MSTELKIQVPRGFRLAPAVCSYGYFILAPNRWQSTGPQRGVFRRPVRDADGRPVGLSVSQAIDNKCLNVSCDRRLARSHHATIRRAVARMLRIDADLRGWRRAHPEAARRGFGRLIRSPTLFEDIVKTITGCNISWPATCRMNRLLCERAGLNGDFPTCEEFARWSAADLASACKVGYRADRIIRLARDFVDGRIDAEWFEDPARTTDELYDALRRIHGIGDYAANNILQLLGRYDRLPVDTETFRHLRHHHGHNGDERALREAARRRYDRYDPYQFLAYWFDIWSEYEGRFGPADRWADDVHERFTASQLNPRKKGVVSAHASAVRQRQVNVPRRRLNSR